MLKYYYTRHIFLFIELLRMLLELASCSLILIVFFTIKCRKRSNNQDDLYLFLMQSYSSRTLKEYIKSYTQDTVLLSHLRTKKQLVSFIMSSNLYIPNTTTCDVCYDCVPNVRVHKCSICTYNTCMRCINKLQVPVSCPQCRTHMFLFNITNYIEWFDVSSTLYNVLINLSAFWLSIVLGYACIYYCYNYTTDFFPYVYNKR